MSGSNTVITDTTPAPSVPINGATSIDLSARTTPISITLTGNGTHTTQIILGSALVTLNAAGDADALNIAGGSGALFLQAGSGALQLNNATGPSYVTGGTGTAAIVANGPVALLPGDGLITVTNDLAGVTIYGNQAGDGFLQETALQAQTNAPLTQLTAQFIPSGQSRTIGGYVFGNDNEVGTATAQGPGDTYFIESYAQGAADEQQPSLYVPFAADATGTTLIVPPTPDAPTATAVWDANTGLYDVTITGQTHLANEGVFVSVDGNLAATTVSTGTGGFSATAALGISAGPHTLTASVDDPAAGNFIDSASGTFTPPPVIIAADGAAPAGTLSATGMAAPGAAVTIAVDGTPEPDATTADSFGDWTIDLAEAFAPGPHTLVAISGGLSSSAFSESVASAGPAITAVLRNDAAAAGTEFSMTGTADPGATVTIVADGVPTGQSVVADGTGAWSADVSGLAAGTHSVDVTTPDPNNPGSTIASNTETVDVAAPPVLDAPTLIGADLTVSGTTNEPGDVTVSVDGVALAPVTASGGAFTVILPTLSGGAHTIAALQVEALTATPGIAGEIVVIPVTPTIGYAIGAGQLTLAGAAASGSTVTVHQDNAADQTATADGSGHWSLTEAIPTAAANATAEVADLFVVAGVLDSAPLALPVAPVITGADPNAAQGIAFSAAGTAAPDAAVAITVDGATTPVTADAFGNWSFDAPGPVPAGPHAIVASVADGLGGTLRSAAYTAIVASQAPVITGPVIASGGSPTALFAVSGTADPDAIVTIEIDNDPSRTVRVTAGTDGNWIAPVPGTVAGTLALSASTVDANTGATLTSNTDTITLTAPAITAAGFAPPSTDLLVTGTAAAGAAISVTVDDANPVTVTADGSGNFSANLGGQSAGVHSIIASTPDPYGAPIFASAAVSVTVPSTPVIFTAIADATGTVTVTGIADAGATVTVLDGGAADGTTVAGPAGTWSYAIQTPGPVASVTATVSPAGYVALASATVSPPYTAIPPTITGTDPLAPPGALFSIAGHATDNVPLTITLDGTALASVTASAAGGWAYDQTTPVPAGPHIVGVRTTGTPLSTAVTAPVVVASHAPTLSTFANPGAATGTVVSVQGTADANAIVTLSANGQVLPVTVTAGAGGTWSADLSGLSGTETLVATTQDANGPAHLASVAVTVTLPAPPALFYAALATAGSGTETLTVYGTSAPGTPVTLTDHAGAALGTATTDALGHFGLVVPIDTTVIDPSTITASVPDPYASAPVATTVTTPFAAPPAAPTITATGPASPASIAALEVSGTANPGAVVTVSIGGTSSTATAQAGVDGTWTTPIASPGPGSYALTATVPGLSGGLAGGSNLTSGTTALHLATIPTLTSEDTSQAPAGIALELHGSADPSASVTVTLDGSAPATVRANAQGNWVDDIAAAAAGTHAVALASADPTLGVTLSGSGDFTLTVPAILGAIVDGAHFLTVSGTATPGEIVTVASDALAQPLTTTADGAGAWQVGFTAGSGAHSVTAFAFDPTRNTQASSGATGFAVPVAFAAAPTDPLELALLAAQTVTAGTILGPQMAAIPASGALRSSVIAAGASGTIAAPAGAQLVLNTATAPITLMGNGASNAIIRNAGGKFTFMTGGGSGVFLDGTSTTDDHFEAPMTGGGNYAVQLGSGNNLVEAHSGDTTIDGGAGANSIWLGSGHATVSLTGVGKDTVVTGSGTASVHAVGSANELVFQGSGDLTFDNNSGTATVAGGSGSSTIHAWGGSGVFWGGSGGYSQLSANSDCTLVSGGDNDHLLAWGFHNELWAVHGNASIQAVGGGDNLLVGGDGNDWMAGFGAGDTLLGGLGNSTLWGGAGDELIHLSQKSSIVYAGNGNETLIAGAGSDEFVFFKRPGVNTYEIQGFKHGLDHVSFADHTQADQSAAIRTQTVSAAGVTLTLGDGTRIVFAGLDKFAATDVG